MSAWCFLVRSQTLNVPAIQHMRLWKADVLHGIPHHTSHTTHHSLSTVPPDQRADALQPHAASAAADSPACGTHLSNVQVHCDRSRVMCDVWRVTSIHHPSQWRGRLNFPFARKTCTQRTVSLMMMMILLLLLLLLLLMMMMMMTMTMMADKPSRWLKATILLPTIHLFHDLQHTSHNLNTVCTHAHGVIVAATSRWSCHVTFLHEIACPLTLEWSLWKKLRREFRIGRWTVKA